MVTEKRRHRSADAPRRQRDTDENALATCQTGWLPFVLWGHIIGNPHAADKGCSISTFRSHAQADQNECQTWFREGGCVVAINVKFHTMVYIGKLAPAVSRPCPHDTCFGVIYRSLCLLVPQPFGLSGFPIESTMGMKRKLHVDATPAGAIRMSAWDSRAKCRGFLDKSLAGCGTTTEESLRATHRRWNFPLRTRCCKRLHCRDLRG